MRRGSAFVISNGGNMIYRIDIQHFLTHAIDHFTRDELTNFNYVIISAAIVAGPKTQNVRKCTHLYPPLEIIEMYATTNDEDSAKKMYSEYLTKSLDYHNSKSDGLIIASINDYFLNAINNHKDNVILCDRTENIYIDVLCKILKKEFDIDVIDLNQLFTKGYVDCIYIDRDKIWDKSVDIRREAAKRTYQSLVTTRDGREKIISQMNKKEKMEKLKELGFKIPKFTSIKEIDKMLYREFVDSDEDD